MKQMFDKTLLSLASEIIEQCYWDNNSYSPEYILDNVKDDLFSQKIFNNILLNSPNRLRHICIFEEDVLRRCVDNVKLDSFPVYAREIVEGRLKGIKVFING